MGRGFFAGEGDCEANGALSGEVCGMPCSADAGETVVLGVASVLPCAAKNLERTVSESCEAAGDVKN